MMILRLRERILSILNKDLIDLYDKKLTIETKLKKVEEKATPTVQNNTQTNNNIYVGTTDELFEQLQKQGLLDNSSGVVEDDE